MAAKKSLYGRTGSPANSPWVPTARLVSPPPLEIKTFFAEDSCDGIGAEGDSCACAAPVKLQKKAKQKVNSKAKRKGIGFSFVAGYARQAALQAQEKSKCLSRSRQRGPTR